MGLFDRFKKPAITEIENATKTQPKSGNVKERVVTRQQYRQKESVKGWRNATIISESTINPNRVDLIRIYRDLLLDPHLNSIVDTMLLQVTKSEYYINNASGEKDEADSGKAQKEYFSKIIGWLLEVKLYGYSAIELGSLINDDFPNICLIPREYIVPEFRGVSKELRVTTDLIKFDDPRYKDNVVFIGEPYDLGLLHKAAPIVIYKKETTINWQTFTEVFGHPLRVGKTEIRDPEKRQNMDKMLAEMGSSAYAVLDPDDVVEFVESSKTDAYETYLEFIKMSNSELSKLILGQTMTTEDGSSKSQAEVHENILNDRVSDWKKYVTNAINREVMPKLIKKGVFKSGAVFSFDNEEKISNATKMELLPKMLPFYKISPDEIKEITGIDVDEKPQTEPSGIDKTQNITSVISDVQNAYKGYFDQLDGGDCC